MQRYVLTYIAEGHHLRFWKNKPEKIRQIIMQSTEDLQSNLLCTVQNMRVLIVFVLLLTCLIRCQGYTSDKTLEGALRNAGWICRDPEIREKFYDHGPCTCGPSCARLGTCCQDSEYFLQEKQSWGKHIPSCIVMTGSYILVQTSCPSYWEHNDTRTRCEQPDITYSDPLLDVPVTSRRTNITYYNGHCAICHQDFDPSVDVLWPFEFICGPSDLLYDIFYKTTYVYNFELEPCFDTVSDSFTNMTNTNQENTTPGCTHKDYSYGRINFQTYQNITSVTSAKSLTECISYSVSGSSWHIDLTCAYFYYYKDRLQIVENSNIIYDYNDDNNYGGNNTLLQTSATLSNYDYNFFPPLPRQYLVIPVGTIECSVKILQPTGMSGTGLKFCPNNYVQTCAKDWGDKQVQDRCNGYTSNWCDEDDVYRNVYCAYCNYVDEFKDPNCWRVGAPTLSHDFSILLKWYDLNSRCSDTEIFDEVKHICRNKDNFNEGKEFNISRLRNKKGLETDKPMPPVLGYVTIVGLILSITCLILHLLVFIITPKQRNLPAMNLASLCVSLLFLYCCFMVSGYLDPPCAALAVTLHYTLLVTFFWMAAISFDVWKTITLSMKVARASQGPQWKKFCVYSTFCWIVPLIVIASALIVEFCVHDSNFRPGYGVTNCWIGNRDALLVFVVAPLCIVMTLNAVFFSWSSCLIYFAKKTISNSSNARTDFRLFVRLAIIMGLTWITGLVAALLKTEVVWCVFVVLNTLQGLFIFIAFSCRRKMWDELRAEISIFWTTSTSIVQLSS